MVIPDGVRRTLVHHLFWVKGGSILLNSPPHDRRDAEDGCAMQKPVIFTISATWDAEASVWTGHCDDIPAAADAATLDELLARISAMALDLLPDNHPDIDPGSVFVQITALREAEPAVA
jgi:hypothetical protein